MAKPCCSASMGRSDFNGPHARQHDEETSSMPSTCSLATVTILRICRSPCESPAWLSQKSFWGDEPQFSWTLTRVARGDARDHVVPRKNDHGPAQRRDGASQRYSSLKITFREFLGSSDFRLLQQNRPVADISTRTPERSGPCPSGRQLQMKRLPRHHGIAGG